MDDQDWINLQKLVAGGPQPDLDSSADRPTPARDAHGRFVPGWPGRPLGARNRISRRIGLAILRHYEENEPEILTRLMELRHFPIYMRLVSRMLPDGPLEDELNIESLSPEDLDKATCAVKDALKLARDAALKREEEARLLRERWETDFEDTSEDDPP